MLQKRKHRLTFDIQKLAKKLHYCKTIKVQCKQVLDKDNVMSAERDCEVLG